MPYDPYEGVSPLPWVKVQPKTTSINWPDPNAPQIPPEVKTVMKPGIKVFDTAPSFFDMPQIPIPLGSNPMMTMAGNEFWTMPEYFRNLADTSYVPELMGSYPMSTMEQHGMYTMPEYFQNLYQ